MDGLSKTIDYSVNSSAIEKFCFGKYLMGKIHGVGTREEQQDSFGVSDLTGEAIEKRGTLFVLSDGMGGLQSGAEISAIAVVSCLQQFELYADAHAVDLKKMIYTANQKVLEYIDEKNIEYGGATGIVVWIYRDKFKWVSIGDSHLCIYHNKRIRQLNSDHIYYSQLMEEVKKGLISKEDAEKDPQKEALTSYIGIRGNIEIDFSDDFENIENGDRILLLSDGVYKSVLEDDMIEILNRSMDISMAELEYQILHAGKKNQDNYTAIVIERCE